MRIELVSAATHPRETQIYYASLMRSYARFQAAGAAAGRVDGDRRAGLFFALARDRQRVLGGVGIHVRGRAGTLPVERALPDNALLRRKLEGFGSVAELSGLWVRDELRGTGVSLRLMQAAMGALPLLECPTGVGFSHQHVLPLYANIGLFPDPELSSIPYPDDRYASSVLWADAVTLAGVSAVNRARILQARAAFESGHKVHFRVELRLPPGPSSRPPAARPRASLPPRDSVRPRASSIPPRSSARIGESMRPPESIRPP